MGVAADHFVADALDHIVEGEAACFAGHLGVEDDLQQQVAEFFFQVGHVVMGDGVGDFVGFLDGVGGDGGEGLLEVPRAAAVGVAQAGHDLE